MHKVYVMKTIGYVKIGVTSDNIESRLKSVQTGCPIFIHQVNYWEIKTRALAFNIEKDLHKILADRNTYGEWFRNTRLHSSQIRKVIEEYGIDFDDLNVVFLGKKQTASSGEIQDISKNIKRAVRQNNIERLIGLGKRIEAMNIKKKIDELIYEYREAINNLGAK